MYGLIVGVVPKFLTPRRDTRGMIVTITLGIVGALIGGFIAQVKKEANCGEKIVREPALYMSGGIRKGILFV